MVQMVNFTLRVFYCHYIKKKKTGSNDSDLIGVGTASRKSHRALLEPQKLDPGWEGSESCVGGSLNEPLVGPVAQSAVTAEQESPQGPRLLSCFCEPCVICTAHIISGT